MNGKTKVFSTLFAVATCLQALGVVHLTPEQLAAIQAIFGAGTAWGFRDAIDKAAGKH